MKFFIFVLLAFIQSGTALADDVIVIIEDADSFSTYHKKELTNYYQSRMYEQRKESSNPNSDKFFKPKMVFATISSTEDIESLGQMVTSQMKPGDKIHSVVISAHGNPEKMVIGMKGYTGAQLAKSVGDFIVPLPHESNLNVYLWSCMNGCRLGQTSNFQESFTSTLAPLLNDVERLDVLAHMSLSYADGDSVKSLSWISRLSMRSGFAEAASKMLAKGVINKKLRSFINSHPTLNTFIMGDQFTGRLVIPGLLAGFVSLGIGLSLVKADPILSGGLIAGAITLMSGGPTYLIKEIETSMKQLIRRISVQGGNSKEEVGALSEMLRESTCKSSIGDI